MLRGAQYTSTNSPVAMVYGQPVCMSRILIENGVLGSFFATSGGLQLR